MIGGMLMAALCFAAASLAFYLARFYVGVGFLERAAELSRDGRWFAAAGVLIIALALWLP
jgi:hypothetical protein